jgi:PRTRC genetic system protein E
VNVIPAKAKDGEDLALTTPLGYAGSAEELDRELGKHLPAMLSPISCSENTLAESKAEMDAAAKAARQKARTAQQSAKSDSSTVKKEETA